MQLVDLVALAEVVLEAVGRGGDLVNLDEKDCFDIEIFGNTVPVTMNDIDT